jgi:hypothetical protein
MPGTPKGHKRPADVAANAVHVMRAAVGEIEESGTTEDGKSKAAVELARKGGLARAKSVPKKERIRIARKAAKALWADRLTRRSCRSDAEEPLEISAEDLLADARFDAELVEHGPLRAVQDAAPAAREE